MSNGYNGTSSFIGGLKLAIFCTVNPQMSHHQILAVTQESFFHSKIDHTKYSSNFQVSELKEPQNQLEI